MTRKVNEATAVLPTTKVGRHGSKGAITIEATHDGELIGTFSISHAGLQFRPKKGGKVYRRHWKSVADFVLKTKKGTSKA